MRFYAVLRRMTDCIVSRATASSLTFSFGAHPFCHHQIDIDQIEVCPILCAPPKQSSYSEDCRTQAVHDNMRDLLEQANEVQEALGRSYAVPDEIDEADLQAGGFPLSSPTLLH